MDAKTETYERKVRVAAHTGTLITMPFGCVFVDPDVKYILSAKYDDGTEAKIDHTITVELDKLVVDLYNPEDKAMTVRYIFFVTGEFLSTGLFDKSDDTIEVFDVNDDDEYDGCDGYDDYDEYDEPCAVTDIRSRCKLAEDAFRAMLKK